MPTRDQLTEILEAVRAEPDGPDKTAAMERLEAQLVALDDPDRLEVPDADLFPQDDKPVQ